MIGSGCAAVSGLECLWLDLVVDVLSADLNMLLRLTVMRVKATKRQKDLI